jgi:hypothetical protein
MTQRPRIITIVAKPKSLVQGVQDNIILHKFIFSHSSKVQWSSNWNCQMTRNRCKTSSYHFSYRKVVCYDLSQAGSKLCSVHPQRKVSATKFIFKSCAFHTPVSKKIISKIAHKEIFLTPKPFTAQRATAIALFATACTEKQCVITCRSCVQQLRRFRASCDVWCLQTTHLRVCYRMDHMWRCLGFRHHTSQLAQNLLTSCTQPLHVITRWSRQVSCFSDFVRIFCNLEFRTTFPVSCSSCHDNKMLDISCELLDTASIYTKYHEYHFFESPNYMISCTYSSNVKCV